MNTKKCKKCKEDIPGDAKICSKCGSKQGFPKWAIILIVVVVLFLFLGTGDSEEKPSNDYDNESPGEILEKEENNNGGDDQDNKNNSGVYGLGDTFKFDDLEITIGKKLKFTKVKNQYSEYNKKTVVGVPVVVKNLKSETHSLNMFYYNYFGSKGTEVANVFAYFDNSVDSSGDLRSGATSKALYFYMIYDGDGTYAIEFDDWSEKITVEFEVKKAQ